MFLVACLGKMTKKRRIDEMDEALKIHKAKFFETFMGVEKYTEAMEFRFEGKKGVTLLAYETWKKNVALLAEYKRLEDQQLFNEMKSFLKKNQHIYKLRERFILKLDENNEKQLFYNERNRRSSSTSMGDIKPNRIVLHWGNVFEHCRDIHYEKANHAGVE